MTTAGRGEVADGFLDALLDDDPERLYEDAPCGYLSTTPDGTIIKINRTMLRLLGYESHQLVGSRRFADLLSPGGRIYHETHFSPMLRMHGLVQEIALDLVHRNGSRLPVLVNAALESSENGAPIVVRVAVFDARHRREYERELLREKERAEASEAHALALARTLQHTFIPPTPPHIPGLDVGAEYRPAGDGSQVGGDFYDVFQAGPDDWVVVIGDVCGKGVQAAVITGLARYTLRAAAMQERSPAHALVTLNDVLGRHETEKFCTAAIVRLQLADGGWQGVAASAGHPLPLLRRADGSVDAVGVPGSLLGIFDSIEVHETPVVLGRQETLLLYTDGVPEARLDGAFYGEGRIRAVAATTDGATELASALLDDVMSFQGGTARDDIAIVAVSRP